MSDRNAPPPGRWASSQGEDAIGVFADLEVGDHRIRFRWLPPTRLEHGVWMSDRLISRGLHEDLAGEIEAPSSELPWVTHVTWTGAGRACTELTRRHPADDKMVFRLPLEGEWARASAMSTGPGEPTALGIGQMPCTAWEWTMTQAAMNYAAMGYEFALGPRGHGPYRVLCGQHRDQWGEVETRRLAPPWAVKGWASYRICRGRPAPM